MANIDIQRLFLKIGQLQETDANGLSPGDTLRSYLTLLDTQIKGSEQGHMAGYAAAYAGKSRQNSPRAARTPAEEATAEFELQETLADPSNTIDPRLFEDMDPETQEAFQVAYAEAYREGYAKGSLTEPVMRTPMSQADIEAVFDGKAAYSVDGKDQEILAPGLWKPKDNASFDQETIGNLSQISGVDAKELAEAILDYTHASEDDRDTLLDLIENPPEVLIQSNFESKHNVDQLDESLISHAFESENQADAPSEISASDQPELPQASALIESDFVAESTIHAHHGAQDKPQDVSEGIRQVISALANKDPELVKQETFSAQRSETSHNKPIHFTKAVESIFSHSIKDDYLAKKSKNIAQLDIFSRKKTRKEQMGLIDDIREHLALHAPDIKSHDYDQDKALILYAVMKAIQEDVQKEFRWTKIFGTKSRLELVLKEDMDAIKANFPKADFSEKNAKALIDQHLKKDPAIHEECAAILGHIKFHKHRS